MPAIVPEDLNVVMARITRRARAATDQWTSDELQDPRLDRPRVEQAIQRWLVLQDKPTKPLHWFRDGCSARAYIRSRAAEEPLPVYWPSIQFADALDMAWFAGAMRPPIRIYANWTAATVQWEHWVYGVRKFNAALALQPDRSSPPELLPIQDGLAEPPDAGRPVPKPMVEAVLSQYPGGLPSSYRTIHPEQLWMPLIEAFSGGLYYFWQGPDEVVGIPRPALWIAEGRLHREDGPAVLWPSGEMYCFRNGTECRRRNSVP